jgi:phosphoenolpyruvate synthase/pyruvate phosphate dikinase
MRYIRRFSELTLDDAPLVGGKNASLGEMYQALATQGVKIPNGFASTAEAYRHYIKHNKLHERIAQALGALDSRNADALAAAGARVRNWIMHGTLPEDLAGELNTAYRELEQEYGPNPDVAVRSSAIAEMLPGASFAGLHDTYLNIRGSRNLLETCRRVYASLFTDRAIAYRIDQGISHLDIALSIGVQKMVRSDMGAAGVMFTLDKESGFRDVVCITAAFGLGETVVQGKVNPDAFYVFKPTLTQDHRPIIKRRLGDKAIKMVYAGDPMAGASTRNVPVPEVQRGHFALDDDEVLELTRHAVCIENHFSQRAGHDVPMDIEWAKDGESDAIYIVQARPETAPSTPQADDQASDELTHLTRPRTRIMLNIGNPEQAFTAARLPCDGVGLARLEFIINTSLRIHPRAVLDYARLDADTCEQINTLSAGYDSPTRFYVERLAEGVGTIAAAFHPKPVIVRLSDFKTNEYATLLGGAAYEPKEENPMLGWRGAARYPSQDFAAAFALECAALKKVRDTMGLANVALMVPFVRSVAEGEQVLALLATQGLRRGENGLKIYLMCEIPANALLADEFLEHFDGFSIGSNDLTQLTLGVDRASNLINGMDERNPAVLKLMEQAIAACRRHGKYIGICGQAPADFPEITRWLVEHGIDSISLDPDSVRRMTAMALEMEMEQQM